jgi:WD40 repeat protein
LHHQYGGKSAPEACVFTRSFPDYKVSENGRYLGFASNNSLSVYDTETGKKRWKAKPLHKCTLCEYQFSADGILVAAIGDNNIINALNVGDTQSLVVISTDQSGNFIRLRFSPGRDLLASSDENGKVRFWNIATGRKVGQALSEHSGMVRTLAFSADGKHLASGGEDGRVVLWDTITGNAVAHSPALHPREIADVTFLPDSRWAISVDEPALNVVIWDKDTGLAIGQPLVFRSTNSANRPSLFPMEDCMITVDGGRILFWEMSTSAWLERASKLVGETK